MNQVFRKSIFSFRKIRIRTSLSKSRGLNYWVIISAAGLGSRMKSKVPKQYLYLRQETILKRSIHIFLKLQHIKKVIVTVDSKDIYWDRCQILHKKVAAVTGGKTRSISISKGLNSLQDMAHDRDWVLIHDAVRPCVSEFFMNNLFLLTHREEVGGLPVIPIFDTVKNYQCKTLLRTAQRENLYVSQTPQIFRYGVIKKGLDSIIKSKVNTTDESNAIELIGELPRVVIGDRSNIKITSSADIDYINKVLS